MKFNKVYVPGFADWFFPVLIITAIVVLGVTLHDLVFSAKEPSNTKKFGWLAFWTLAPALWFAIEYHWVYPTFRDPTVNFEVFKYGQEVAGKFWAGVVALVGAIALKK